MREIYLPHGQLRRGPIMRHHPEPPDGGAKFDQTQPGERRDRSGNTPREITNPRVSGFLDQYVGDRIWSTMVLSAQAGELSPGDRSSFIDAMQEDVAVLTEQDRHQLITAIIQGQVTPDILPGGEERVGASRTLLSQLRLSRSDRFHAAQSYTQMVESIDPDIAVERLAALEETGTILLGNYTPSSTATQDEESLGHATLQVAQRLDRVRQEQDESYDDEGERRSEQDTLVRRLANLGFRASLIRRVTGLSPLKVRRALEVMRQEAAEDDQEEVWVPEARTERFVAGVLNNPVKIAMTIAIAGRKTPPTAKELDELFPQLQVGQVEPYVMSQGAPRNMVLRSLIPFGIVEKVNPPRGERTGAMYRITEDGAAGVALLGHALRFSEQLVERDPTLSLSDFFSTSNTPKAKVGMESATGDTTIRRAPTTNLLVFSELVRLYNADKLPIREIDMRSLLNETHSMGDRLTALRDRDIISYRSAAADTSLEPPFEKLQKAVLTVTAEQADILDSLVDMVKKFEQNDPAFLREGRVLAEDIMGSPERMARILRPMHKQRLVGGHVYAARIKEIIDSAQGDISPREIADQMGGVITRTYVSRIARELLARNLVSDGASGTALRLRKKDEADPERGPSSGASLLVTEQRHTLDVPLEEISGAWHVTSSASQGSETQVNDRGGIVYFVGNGAEQLMIDDPADDGRADDRGR